MSMLLISPLLCCAMFNINNVSAASLTLTVPDTPISLDLTPTQEGSFAKSNASTVSVKTDAFAGYTLTIASKDSSSSDSGNSLVNRVNEEHKLLSIPSSITEEEFKSNSQYNNMWGYMPSKLDSNDNSNYIAGPTINATTID